MTEIPRNKIHNVLDESGVEGDRTSYYRFVDRLTFGGDMNTKEELEKVIEEFKARGCDEEVLWKLVDLTIERCKP